MRFCELMKLYKKAMSNRSFLVFMCVLVVVASAASARANGDKKKVDAGKAGTTGTSVHIKNFGQVNDFYYRGAQPEAQDYADLARIGIKTVIDLRDEPASFAAKSAADAGLRYINFPLSDTEYPAKDVANKFLSIVTDESNWPVYVHCAGGRHRTGAMTAVYRMTIEGWDTAKAYEEMKQYDFYTRWGHGSIKDYVFDYGSSQMDDKRTEWYAKGKAMKSSLALGALNTTTAPTSTGTEAVSTPHQ
jgi:tyrosine-protein phosphatase SIW14